MKKDKLGFDEYQCISFQELLTITGLTANKLELIYASESKETGAAFFNGESFDRITGSVALHKLYRDTFQMRSHLSLPIQLTGGETCCFSFYSRRPDTYNAEHINLFHRLEHTLAKNIQKKIEEVNAGVRTNFLQKQVSKNNAVPFDGIIGKSHLLLSVFDDIAQVAPFDTSILILGESGTGKEKIADSIHRLSPRKSNPLVKVNCAALPATLIESELFGHKKGAFTGATNKRTGKFEQANGGTIFLDEIGEMPLDLQVKLLRVLQEREIEPVGSKLTIKINVRVIALPTGIWKRK